MIWIIFTIILLAVSIASWVYTIHLRNQQYQIVEINNERLREKEEIEQEISSKQDKLNELKNSIQSQNNILQSLTATAEELRKDAEQRAEKDYEARSAALTAEFGFKEKILLEKYERQKQAFLDKISKEENKLKDLEAKQLAYFEAQKRQEEIEAQKDYYRLTIDEIDLEDITLLRELQFRFVKKDVIDKLIWEVYYKPAYDILMSHLFATSNKVCGIYKITDLTTNQSYIGQSVDIKERFRQHIKSALTYGKASNKLYQTMQKSGVHNFTFEILEQIDRSKLNERETYWIEFYKTKDFGLNSTRGGS